MATTGQSASADTTRQIICAIDCLKGRKARPDETKICHYVERKFGIKKDDTIAAIDAAVHDGSVLKVKYKDSVSYRNPLKFSQKMSNRVHLDKSCAISSQTLKRFVRHLRLMCRTRPDGVSRPDLTRDLQSDPHFARCGPTGVDKLITRAIQTASVKQMSNNNYTVVFGKRLVKEAAKVTESLNADCDDSRSGDNQELTKDSSTASNGLTVSSSRKRAAKVMARERPVSKRKKFKKCLGPDFIVSSELGLQYMKNSFDPKCDLCQNSSKCGQNEQLLTCKDCSAKAHPSCMDYSAELAERSSRSPWQCMDCKTCDICHDPKDAANMLVCDLCDKGFHMNCHIPVVECKPIGKWECNECIDNNNNNGIQVTAKTNAANDGKRESDRSAHIRERLIQKRNSLDNSSLSSVASNSKENYGNSYPEVVPNPQKWSPEDVGNFIRNIGFPEQSELFREQEIDGTSLLLLRRSDVLTGFHMKLGPALKIYSHIMRLQKRD